VRVVDASERSTGSRAVGSKAAGSKASASKASAAAPKKSDTRAEEEPDTKPKRPKPTRQPQLLDDKPSAAPTKDDGRLF
jgi:hypothetical protein